MLLRRKAISLVLALGLLGAGVVSAHEILQGDQCTIASDRTVKGNLFVLCRTLVVNGRVEGNLFGVATTTIINGRVDGDTYLVSGELDLYGTLGDDLHFAGLVLQIHDNTKFRGTRSDLIALGLSTALDRGVRVPGSVIAAGYQVVLDGQVDHDISFWGSALTVGGIVAGDVDALVGDSQVDPGWLLTTTLSLANIESSRPGLRVADSASIDGQLRYSGPTEGDIQGKLAQRPIYTPVATLTVPLQIGETESSVALYIAQVIHEFITLAIVGFVGLLVAPRLMQAPIQIVRRHPFTSLGVGIPAFFVPMILLFMVTIVTLLIMLLLSLVQLTDLALVSGVVSSLVSITGVGVFYFIAIFIARIVVCLALGQVLVRAAVGDDGGQRLVTISLFVGVFFLAVTASLPGIGWIFNALTLALGLGAIVIFVRSRLRTVYEASVMPARYISRYGSTQTATSQSLTTPQFPPPIIDDTPRPPGMDNLPPGFTWWDDE